MNNIINEGKGDFPQATHLPSFHSHWAKTKWHGSHLPVPPHSYHKSSWKLSYIWINLFSWVVVLYMPSIITPRSVSKNRGKWKINGREYKKMPIEWPIQIAGTKVECTCCSIQAPISECTLRESQGNRVEFESLKKAID